MKLVLIGFTTTWVIFIFNVPKSSVNGQDFNNASKFFKKFEFEKSLRGSFNISHCIKSLINCMELVRSDTICAQGRYHMTVCGVLHEECQGEFGDYDSYRHRLQIDPVHCLSSDDAKFS